MGGLPLPMASTPLTASFTASSVNLLNGFNFCSSFTTFFLSMSIITKIASQNRSKRANHYHHINATGFSYISQIIIS